ncbi:MAG TPA: YdcF family protein, partial [Ramlibacter sp.]|nr:YdcF family protein [Ramlibacter sp.]
MEAGEIKSLLAALALPPAGLILLALLGLALARGERRSGIPLAIAAMLALWLLSCNGVSVELARRMLPQYAPATLAQLRQERVQAIVVLGGGVLPEAPEFGQPQPAESTLARLRYG